jgi:prefoldin subunit 5
MTKYLLLVCLLAALQSCSPPTEKKVRDASDKSREIGEKYIRRQYEEYTGIVQGRIKDLDKDIDKLRDVSAAGRQEAGDNLNNSIISLTTEREQLQAKLNLMKEKSTASQDMLNRHWNIYNRAIDSILMDMNAFLEPIKKNEEREKNQK